MTKKQLKNIFEKLYLTYNKPQFIHPDPLEFVYKYTRKADQEIVGLIAASLAYGRVKQILLIIEKVLNIIKEPYLYLTKNSTTKIKKDISGFRYRFTTDTDISSLLIGIKGLLEKYGSLEKAFKCSFSHDKKKINIIYALKAFCDEIRKISHNNLSFLLPCPSKGSACKRINLYLRWMIRKDDVDPGCWKGLPPSILIVPLDTHMFSIARSINFTKRSYPNLKTAIEITERFREINPIDPIKYDFALTRPGIRNEFNKLPFTLNKY